MTVRVHFYSYFRELTGCAEATIEVNEGASLGLLLENLRERYPKLVPMQRSTLVAVGVDYERAEYLLEEGDEVSLFPPVQGG